MADQAAINAYWQQQAVQHQKAIDDYWKSQYAKHHPQAMDPWQENQFQQGMSNANFGYGQGIAQNEYARGQAQQGFEDQASVLKQQFGHMRDTMPFEAGNRGILGSGLWHQGLMDANRMQALKLAMLRRQQGGALGQFDLARQQLEDQRNHSMTALTAARSASLQQGALGLNGYTGA